MDKETIEVTEVVEPTIESMPNGEDKSEASSTVLGIDSSTLLTLAKKVLHGINFVNEKFDVDIDDYQRIIGVLAVAIIAVLLIGKWSVLILSAALLLRIPTIPGFSKLFDKSQED